MLWLIASPILVLVFLSIFIRCAIRFPKATLATSIAIIFSANIYYKNFEEKLRLSYIPKSLNIEKILYAKEESWGFGPGGNETGIIVYKLPDGVAEKITKEGINYFSSLTPRSTDGYDWQGRYENWGGTPITKGGGWSNSEEMDKGNSEKFSPNIDTYLDKYGFGIPIDPVIKSEINTAISNPGSYFAYGRIGVIIVIPKIGKVVYAYNG